MRRLRRPTRRWRSAPCRPPCATGPAIRRSSCRFARGTGAPACGGSRRRVRPSRRGRDRSRSCRAAGGRLRSARGSRGIGTSGSGAAARSSSVRISCAMRGAAAVVRVVGGSSSAARISSRSSRDDLHHHRHARGGCRSARGRYRPCGSPDGPRMLVSCASSGGTQSARAGGTIHIEFSVSIRMMPVMACSNCPRRCRCSGIV